MTEQLLAPPVPASPADPGPNPSQLKTDIVDCALAGLVTVREAEDLIQIYELMHI